MLINKLQSDIPYDESVLEELWYSDRDTLNLIRDTQKYFKKLHGVNYSQYVIRGVYGAYGLNLRKRTGAHKKEQVAFTAARNGVPHTKFILQKPFFKEDTRRYPFELIKLEPIK